MLWSQGQGCPSFLNPLALPARGMDGDSGTWLGEDKGVVLGICKKGAPDPVPPLQVIRPEPCCVCGSRIRFGKTAIKCSQCQLLLHTKCREQCPTLCTPRPHHHAWPREVRGQSSAWGASPCPHEASELLALGCWASAHSGCRAGQ